ncbi:MAG: T9SS type A sorting domain-containing protein [bacterium]|nr:MAG: T9SS type A sorting domain-containing protein [bacterium]
MSDLTPARTPAVGTALAQNYPNPFNPTTTIRFMVGGAVDMYNGKRSVVLDVFDVAGRRVTTVLRDFLPPGQYSVTWNGTDAVGRMLMSGVYFMRLTVEGRSLTRKMVLLR